MVPDMEKDAGASRVMIYTDGACFGNPGPGGYGAVMLCNGTKKELSGGRRETTNNRMELMAVIEALTALTKPCEAEVVTDSKYVRDAIEKKWLAGWRKKGWVTASKTPVKNQDLWKRSGDAQGEILLGARPQRPPGKRALRRPGQDGRRKKRPSQGRGLRVDRGRAGRERTGPGMPYNRANEPQAPAGAGVLGEGGFSDEQGPPYAAIYDAIERAIPGTFAHDLGVIFHYTDLEGLLGILQSQGFWLSDARFMNDSEELLNGRRIAAAVMESCADGLPRGGYREAVAEAGRRIGGDEAAKVYFSSFCMDGDLLEQWRAYAINGKGVSIGFDLSGANLGHFQKLPALSVHKVVYDDDLKREIIRIILGIYGESFAREAGERAGDGLAADYCRELVGMAGYFSCFFKNAAFSTEREVRLVATGDVSSRFSRMRFRVSKGAVVPYVCTNELVAPRSDQDASGRLPVSRVIVGPTSNQDLMVAGLREFFLHNGYDPDLVVRSKVPYRG